MSCFYYICSCIPGIANVCVVPRHSLTRGGIVAIGEELILPLSALGARFPLTRSSHPLPLESSLTQAALANLYIETIKIMYHDEHKPYSQYRPTQSMSNERNACIKGQLIQFYKVDALLNLRSFKVPCAS